MKYGCPNSKCKFHKKRTFIVKNGAYFRRCDSRWIKKFLCQYCRKSFSLATFSDAYRHKKRREIPLLKKLLCSSVSLRRSAKILNLHQKTIERKFLFLAQRARSSQKHFLIGQADQISYFQFDDLITSEHTKLKPVTITIAVDAKRRYVLGAVAKPIGAFGHLAEKSRQKYGRRKNLHKQGINQLFLSINQAINNQPEIRSDKHRNYPEFVEKFFPNANYQSFEGGRGCIVGQGELKKLNHDPLFFINHTCAIFRANISRLIRKTWCTTKKIPRLQDHLDIFIDYYNQEILA